MIVLAPWCTLFSDDIILIDETINEINFKLEFWRQSSEIKDFRLNKNKTKYMTCNFSNTRNGGYS